MSFVNPIKMPDDWHPRAPVHKPRLYCDMDGVLADFDLGFERVMGYPIPPRQERHDWTDEEWGRLYNAAPNFFRELPLMPDALELWAYILPHSPTILTGIPKEVSTSGNQKVEWSAEKFGAKQPIICCRSSEKFFHCHRGDILIDDWEKHRQLWEDAGGFWITHNSARETIAALKGLGL